jgi:type IV secretory pathway VirB2 component (pilin)
MKSQFLIWAIITFPFTVSAQNKYDLLAPIFGTTQIGTIGEYLQLIYASLIGTAALLAVVYIVICGIRMMTTEAVSSKGEAKECIQNAIFGLLLAIFSWAILNTINPALTQTTLGITLPSAQAPSSAPSTPTTQNIPSGPGWYFQYRDPNGNTLFQYTAPWTDTGEKCQTVLSAYKNKGYTIVPTTIGGVTSECFVRRPNTAPVSSTEAQARSKICGEASVDGCKRPSTGLSAGRVYINNKACSNPDVPEVGCTNVAGLSDRAIGIIKQIAGAGCAPVITGGTEKDRHSISGGTSDHYLGNRSQSSTFDLSMDSGCVDNYIMQNGLNRSDGSKTNTGIKSCDGAIDGFCGNMRWFLPYGSSGEGFWFIKEVKATAKSHWHVCEHKSTGVAGNPTTPTPYCNDPPQK